MLTGDFKVRAGLLDFDAGLHQAVDEFGRGGKVGLIGGHDVAARVLQFGIVEDLVVEIGRNALGAWACGVARVGREYAGAVDVCPALFGFGLEGFYAFRRDGPVVLAAVLNGVLAHQIEVVEEVGALAGGIVEHGAVVGLLVGDGRGVVPELRLDGFDKVVARELLAGEQGQWFGSGVADDLGQEADLVVEVRDGAEAAVEPRGVRSATA